MTPEVIELMRKAKVPWVEGMRLVRPGRLDQATRHRVGDEGYAFVDKRTATWSLPDGRPTVPPGSIPDLADRATFLLCVDELERRTPDGVTLYAPYRDGATLAFALGDARALYCWEETSDPADPDHLPEREHLIIGLARALAETAPDGQVAQTSRVR